MIDRKKRLKALDNAIIAAETAIVAEPSPAVKQSLAAQLAMFRGKSRRLWRQEHRELEKLHRLDADW